MTYQLTFHALADQTRRDVLQVLVRAPAPVGEIANQLPVSRPAVSQHLKVLTDAGLVTSKAEGTRRIYSVQPDKLNDLRRWLDEMWGTALEAFAKAATEEAQK